MALWTVQKTKEFSEDGTAVVEKRMGRGCNVAKLRQLGQFSRVWIHHYNPTKDTIYLTVDIHLVSEKLNEEYQHFFGITQGSKNQIAHVEIIVSDAAELMNVIRKNTISGSVERPIDKPFSEDARMWHDCKFAQYTEAMAATDIEIIKKWAAQTNA